MFTRLSEGGGSQESLQHRGVPVLDQLLPLLRRHLLHHMPLWGQLLTGEQGGLERSQAHELFPKKTFSLRISDSLEPKGILCITSHQNGAHPSDDMHSVGQSPCSAQPLSVGEGRLKQRACRSTLLNHRRISALVSYRAAQRSPADPVAFRSWTV